jgi:hypothetical protein
MHVTCDLLRKYGFFFLGRRDAHVLKSLDVRLRGGRQGERGEDASRHCSGAGEIMGCT